MNAATRVNELEDEEEQKNAFGEFVKTILYALVIAFVMRTFLFQAFHIPSASMEPNLQAGDYIITTKYSLGYGTYAADPLPFPVKKGRIFEREPARGDIIVFKPTGSKVHYVKRLIGLPGDQVQMQGGFLYINQKRLLTEKLATESRVDSAGNLLRGQLYKEYFDGDASSHIIKQLAQGNRGDDTGVFTVPVGQYFYMGDNRDNSGDSRFPFTDGGIGYIPAENLVGRAEFVLLSVEKDFVLFKPWTWGSVRSDRFFKGLR